MRVETHTHFLCLIKHEYSITHLLREGKNSNNKKTIRFSPSGKASHELIINNVIINMAAMTESGEATEVEIEIDIDQDPPLPHQKFIVLDGTFCRI